MSARISLPRRLITTALGALAGLAACAVTLTAMPPEAGAQQLSSTLTRRLPAERHPGFAGRYAVVLAPAAAAGSETAAAAEALTRRLLDYGFEVFALGSVIRADLEGGVRDIARQLQQSPNAEVALLIYGELIKGDDDLYLAPSDLSDAARGQTATLGTSAVRLTDVLRRLSDAQPRRLVVVADGCGAPPGGGSCLAGLESQFAGRAIIATQQRQGARANPGGAMHAPFLTLTTSPGLAFNSLPERLRNSTGTTPVDIVVTPSLPGDFAFLPDNYLPTLPHACNRIAEVLTPAEGPESAVWPHLEACERAVAVWSYATHFRANLAKLRELLAYRRATAGCEAGPAIEAYLRGFAGGAYVEQVRAHQERCKPRITAAQVTSQFDDLIRRRASADDFTGLGRQALEAGHAQGAFRAFEEADPRLSEEAAWHMARFYDPAETSPAYKAVGAVASPANAIAYYALWSARSERHRTALRQICASAAVMAQADIALRRQCP